MADYSKPMGPRTSIWKNSPNGDVLVTTIEDLRYGTQATVHIPGFGEATLAGVTRAGSDGTIVEVRYVLKS